MTSSDKKSLYSIGEAGRMTGLEPHVLRFWETEFELLAPVKNDAGRRVYSDDDIEVVRRIKSLLYDRKFTIEGAKNYLAGGNQVPADQTEFSFDDAGLKETLSQVKKELREILNLLDG